MGHKRRWWSNDDRFKKVQDNLRRNYDKSLVEARVQLQIEFDKKEANLRTEQRNERDRWQIELQRERALGHRLAKEISDFRILLTPRADDRPFVMRAEFAISDRFLYSARDLKEIGPYIVERLCQQIQMEFAKIDWARPTDYRSMWDDARSRWPNFGGPIEPQITRDRL